MTDPIDDISPGSIQYQDTNNEFVCWLDMMGTKSIMSRSLEEYSIKMFKLHNTAILAENQVTNSKHLELYPVMDGVYVVSKTKKALEEYLQLVFNTLADDVADEGEVYHRYIIRAAVAFGPIVHGKEIPRDATHLSGSFKNTLLLGLPMVQAFDYEKRAPPFGIYIHESARSFAPDGEEPFKYVWWKWFEPDDKTTAVKIKKSLFEYYRWAMNNSQRIGYKSEKIEEHKELADQYFPEEPSSSEQSSSPPVTEGDTKEVLIKEMGDEGDGIAKVGDKDFVVFVEGANVGERPQVEIKEVFDNYAFGKIKKSE